MSQVTFSNVESLITSFAKSTKCSKAKITEFVQRLQDEAVVEGAIKRVGAAPGKPTSAESLKIREYILEHKEELAGKKMTVKEFSVIVGSDPATCTNNLKWLAEHKKAVQPAGYAQKEANKRGRAPMLWMVVA